MTEFTLDTSGTVMGYGPGRTPAERKAHLPYPMRWADLDAFTQGYVEAALRGDDPETLFSIASDSAYDLNGRVRVGFSDLAPTTLAAILKDCEARQPHVTAALERCEPSNVGADFWRIRQAGLSPKFPPVALYLGEDGKIYARSAQ